MPRRKRQKNKPKAAEGEKGTEEDVGEEEAAQASGGGDADVEPAPAADAAVGAVEDDEEMLG